MVDVDIEMVRGGGGVHGRRLLRLCISLAFSFFFSGRGKVECCYVVE